MPARVDPVESIRTHVRAIGLSDSEIGTLYTSKQVAALFQVSMPTVYRWCQSGKLASVRLGGDGPHRFRVEDLQAFLEARPY